MATRLDELSERDYPWYVRWVLFTRNANTGRCCPQCGRGAAACDYVRVPFLIGRFKRLASPGPLLRTLMSVRISQINHCEFCVDFNAHNFLAANGAYEKIDFIDRWLEHPEVFSEEERAALAYPEAVTLNDDAGTACAMTELKRFFNDDAIVAITAWLGAPFVPKLHLVEKARMAMNGTLTARDYFTAVCLNPACVVSDSTRPSLCQRGPSCPVLALRGHPNSLLKGLSSPGHSH